MRAADGWRRTGSETLAGISRRPYLVVATKTDKLNQSEQQRGLRAIRKEGVEPLPFSASTAGE